MSLSALALEKAKSQIGVVEIPKGSNKGPEVDQYLKSVGLGPGYMWCMAFVYWCVNEAAKEKGIKNPLYKTGGVSLQYNKSHARVSKTPTVGSVLILDYGNGAGHTGLVESIDGFYVNTIEGNTNNDGSREGYTVCRHRRKISSIKGFINID